MPAHRNGPVSLYVRRQSHQMRISIAEENEYESLVDLLCDLYSYYSVGAEVERESVHEHLRENLLGIESNIKLVIAQHPERGVVGLAAIYFTYSIVDPSPNSRKQCVLKELFVKFSDRSNGIGRALVAWIACHALENGCSRMDWNVKATNDQGLSFYKSVGAEYVAERMSFRLTFQSMQALTSNFAGHRVDA